MAASMYPHLEKVELCYTTAVPGDWAEQKRPLFLIARYALSLPNLGTSYLIDIVASGTHLCCELERHITEWYRAYKQGNCQLHTQTSQTGVLGRVFAEIRPGYYVIA
jgi:hypothetical protein